jgi:TPP-dependent trihydroxycyclohexane-1,2-dione (THcHDO) dehydratase
LAYEQEETIKPQYVVEKLYEQTRGQAIITTEVGQNQMWAAQYYHFDHPSHFITSGGLGCMGFGLPAAIGAQMACPHKTVVDVAGDGSIQMNIQEMATAVQYCLPVKVVILNNGYLGMVRQWQELFYEKRYACTCLDHARSKRFCRKALPLQNRSSWTLRSKKRKASIRWSRPAPRLRKCCWFESIKPVTPPSRSGQPGLSVKINKGAFSRNP